MVVSLTAVRFAASELTRKSCVSNTYYELGAIGGASDKASMQGMGGRMRARARELGWSDTDVARHLGLTQQRYASYVADRHEPDLAMLVRICSVLGMSPDALLLGAGTDEPQDELVARITAVVRVLDHESKAVVAAIVDGLLSKSARMVDAPETTSGVAAPTTARKRKAAS